MKHSNRLITAVLAALVTAAAPGLRMAQHQLAPAARHRGRGPRSYMIQAQLPDVRTIEPNSVSGRRCHGRYRHQDRTAGLARAADNEHRRWREPAHERDGNRRPERSARLTARRTRSTARSRTQGSLRNGSVIPLSSAGTYPSSEQVLAAISLLLNGGGIGQVQDITASLSTALTGQEQDLRSLIEQLDIFTRHVNDQSADIIATAEPELACGDVRSGRNRWWTGRWPHPRRLAGDR